MPIMQTVIQGGGSTDTRGWLPNSIENGKLVYSSAQPNFSGVTSIGLRVLAGRCESNKAITGTVSFPDLVSIEEEDACRECFRYCDNITGVSMPNLTTVGSSHSMESMFENCVNIKTADLGSLTTITGTGALNRLFYGCTELESVDLSSLTSVVVGGSYVFSGCAKLKSIDLSSLTTIGSNGFNYFFYKSGLEELILPNVTSIGYSGCSYMLGQATNMKFLAFPALTAQTIGNQANIFDNMLSGVTGCVVVFPAELQSIIGNWYSVTNGFGGTNTIVLFGDIKNIQVSIPQGYVVYFNGLDITNKSSVYAIIGNNTVEGIDSNGRAFKYTFVADANTTSFTPDVSGLTFNEFQLDSNETGVTFSASTVLYNTTYPLTVDINNKIYATGGYTLNVSGTKSGFYIEPTTASSDTSATITLTATSVIGLDVFDSSNILSVMTGDVSQASVDTTNNLLIYPPVTTSSGSWSAQIALNVPAGTTKIKILTSARVDSELNYDFGYLALGTERANPLPTWQNVKAGTIANGVYIFRQSGHNNSSMTDINYETTDTTQNVLSIGFAQDGGSGNKMWVSAITVIYL